MAEGYRKIAVSKICIAEICFRKKDALFNEGKVVFDIETFDFAGFITDDVIVGYYRNGKYYVYYYYNVYVFRDLPDSPKINMETPVEYSYEQYEIELSTEIHVDDCIELLADTKIAFDENYELKFKGMWGNRMEEVNRVIEYNRNLLVGRQD